MQSNGEGCGGGEKEGGGEEEVGEVLRGGSPDEEEEEEKEEFRDEEEEERKKSQGGPEVGECRGGSPEEEAPEEASEAAAREDANTSASLTAWVAAHEAISLCMMAMAKVAALKITAAACGAASTVAFRAASEAQDAALRGASSVAPLVLKARAATANTSVSLTAWGAAREAMDLYTVAMTKVTTLKSTAAACGAASTAALGAASEAQDAARRGATSVALLMLKARTACATAAAIASRATSCLAALEAPTAWVVKSAVALHREVHENFSSLPQDHRNRVVAMQMKNLPPPPLPPELQLAQATPAADTNTDEPVNSIGASKSCDPAHNGANPGAQTDHGCPPPEHSTVRQESTVDLYTVAMTKVTTLKSTAAACGAASTVVLRAASEAQDAARRGASSVALLMFEARTACAAAAAIASHATSCLAALEAPTAWVVKSAVALHRVVRENFSSLPQDHRNRVVAMQMKNLPPSPLPPELQLAQITPAAVTNTDAPVNSIDASKNCDPAHNGANPGAQTDYGCPPPEHSTVRQVSTGVHTSFRNAQHRRQRHRQLEQQQHARVSQVQRQRSQQDRTDRQEQRLQSDPRWETGLDHLGQPGPQQPLHG